jgi:hypothetical protein
MKQSDYEHYGRLRAKAINVASENAFRTARFTFSSKCSSIWGGVGTIRRLGAERVEMSDLKSSSVSGEW